MPEGHTIHRAARDQGRVLSGHVLAVSSPQGRFAEGAARLDGQRCLAVEAYGKHLVYRFEGDDALHLHLGLFGRMRKCKLPLVEPRGAVRIRLVSPTHFVDINGPTICELLDTPGVLSLCGRIGPDVLRADADPDRAYRRISRSRAPIGRLIMNQSVMAGIGNIYRTEILWRQGIHPDTPGRALDRSAFDKIWQDACLLLALGVKRNAIVAVTDPDGSRGRSRERLNIFNKTHCPKCAGAVRRIDLDGRRAYLCETCQPRPMEALFKTHSQEV